MVFDTGTANSMCSYEVPPLTYTGGPHWFISLHLSAYFVDLHVWPSQSSLL